ncbi:hypothetical protein JTE90_004650 [Oedothorax gibbosus]|uniref:PR domain zinc finger protein 10 n=1 Tax=Oedothorax gibbosus TaxID=931172 RepID=A0AAV6UXI0_9ARAC|nr:hypothetical protein JTE90_004650 [Oedothorax gibbosus]
MEQGPQKKRVCFSVEHVNLLCEWENCGIVENDIDIFIDHITTEHLTKLDSNDLHCHWEDCEGFMDNLPEFRRHILLHAFHSKIKCYGANLQDRRKLSSCLLSIQSRNIVPELPEPLICGWDDCTIECESPEYFYRHVNGHAEHDSKSGPSVVLCLWQGCTRTFSDAHKVKDHLRSHTQEKLVACPTCGGMFASRTKFFDHIQRQQVNTDSKTELYACEYCPKKLNSERLLRDHMRHHVNHYKCPFCDMTCPTPSGMANHITYRHSKEKPHSCQYCDYRGKSESDLRKHLESHSNAPTYKCSIENCTYESRSHTCYKAHFRKIHEGKQPVKYSCHLCEKVFSRGNYLSKHLLNHHKFRWPSGHCRFRYCLNEEGVYRLQTVRYESLELSEEMMRKNSDMMDEEEDVDNPTENISNATNYTMDSNSSNCNVPQEHQNNSENISSTTDILKETQAHSSAIEYISQPIEVNHSPSAQITSVPTSSVVSYVEECKNEGSTEILPVIYVPCVDPNGQTISEEPVLIKILDVQGDQTNLYANKNEAVLTETETNQSLTVQGITSNSKAILKRKLMVDVGSFCEVGYVNDGNSIEYQTENFVNHFKNDVEDLSPVVSYGQYNIDPCTSSGTYTQVSLPSYSPVGNVSTSNENHFQGGTDQDASHDQEVFISCGGKRVSIQSISVSQILQDNPNDDTIASNVHSPSGSANVLNLHEDSVDSHHSQVQEPNTDDPMEPVAMSVDNLQHVSIVHHGIPNLNLPILLDRNSIAALISSSRDGSLMLDLSNLPRSLLSSPGQRTLVLPDQSQYLAADLSPMLSNKDILNSMISNPSTSTSQASTSSMLDHSFPLSHKQMLAQKYAAELSDQQLIESMAGPSGASDMIDSNGMSVYSEHPSSMANTSGSQCLPLDVYAIDRGVSLVTSSRDSPESAVDNVEYQSVSNHSSSHHSVQNYVSSSVDLVHSHQLDHSMHCAVDSTVGPKLHQSDDNIVESSDGYNEHLESSDDVLHTTTGGNYHCHIADMNSCDNTSNEAVTSVLSTSSNLEANEALSATNHNFSNNQMDELQSCATVSSATHPDSTRSPVGISENSSSYPLTPVSLANSQDVHSEYSRPRRDLKSNRTYSMNFIGCEDCNGFYEKECPQHRIQLIYDKPVLSRAWASLPAQYLYVNKISVDEEGDPVYGVFAKKSIPKRTQFGPVEGVLVKREDPPSDHFILVLEHEENLALYLDTTDESMSNWMRFVRPADSYKEQNLVLVQQGQSLFFNTTRSINPKSELRVWYSTTYAEKWGLSVLEPSAEEKKALQEQEKDWPCFECNQRFSTSIDLQKHLNQHDEENDALEGPRIRPKVRPRAKLPKKGLVARLRLPCKQEEYKCDICFKSFPRNYSLQRHLIMHTGEKKYKCPICDIKFSHVYNRNRHVRRHKHENGDMQLLKPIRSLFKKRQGAEWVCTHCDLTFDNSNVLNLHTLTHAAEDVAFNEEHPFLEGGIGMDDGFDGSDESKFGSDEPHKCPECTEEFSSRRHLIEHASVHGKIGKQRCIRGIINPLKPYKCNLCYKSFASDERLIRHYLVHGSEDSKPLQCEICYKRFLNNSALACHIKVHSEERKYYECPICKIEFDQIVALKDHVHIHCENGVYNCPNCHKIFDEYNQVRKHIRAFHSERRYPCEKCDKIFPRPDKLKLHMLRHSDHREFLCANCGKQFKRKDKLKEHMKRMHAPDREAKVNAKNSKTSSSKKFVPKVSPTDYHRFIYKCHTCLLGFKRRGMLVNHLAKRHPDIRPESVPELNLPILKTTRDYYCQYCEKVYKSSSKRKAHILKNHPGSELPMSNRRKGGVPEIPGLPNPTFSQTVGSITTHPHHCNWCHKQYASKAKLLQHQRKKHVDMLALSYVANNTKVEPVCDQGTQVPGQIVIEGITNPLNPEATAVLIDTAKRKIHYVDKETLVVTTHPDGLPTADLLTQAMSELTQNFSEYRTAEFLAARLSHSNPASLVNPSPSTTPLTNPDSPDSPPPVLDTSVVAPLDQIQLNQLLAQYQQQQQLSPQQLAVVVTSVSRAWPTAVSTSLSNYPAR